MCQPNTAIAKEALELLEDFGISLADSRLHLRTAYRQSSLYGGTVHDMGSKAMPAITEVESLTSEILALMEPQSGVA